MKENKPKLGFFDRLTFLREYVGQNLDLKIAMRGNKLWITEVTLISAGDVQDDVTDALDQIDSLEGDTNSPDVDLKYRKCTVKDNYFG